MTVKLYALKCDQGYIHYHEDECRCVRLEKASVYPAPDNPDLNKATAAAGRTEFNNLKIVELTLVEKDYQRL